jgi:hypothetical protein
MGMKKKTLYEAVTKRKRKSWPVEWARPDTTVIAESPNMPKRTTYISSEPVGDEAGDDGCEHVAPQRPGADDAERGLVGDEGLHEGGDKRSEDPPLGEVEHQSHPADEEEEVLMRPYGRQKAPFS